mgnify:CR=1 FL=1
MSTYWLIEKNSPAQYVQDSHYGGITWTDDPHQAKKHMTMEHAELTIKHSLLDGECDLRICEHMFDCGISPEV